MDLDTLSSELSVVEALQWGIPEPTDPDGQPHTFAKNGYPVYSRRHQLILSHLSVYRAAATPLARRDVLLGVCELSGMPPPEVDLSREDYDGERLIRERVEAHVSALEAREAHLQVLDNEAKARRLALFKSNGMTSPSRHSVPP